MENIAPVAAFSSEQFGLSAFVRKVVTRRGVTAFVVTFRDDDAEEFLPVSKSFRSLEDAIESAKQFAFSTVSAPVSVSL